MVVIFLVLSIIVPVVVGYINAGKEENNNNKTEDYSSYNSNYDYDSKNNLNSNNEIKNDSSSTADIKKDEFGKNENFKVNQKEITKGSWKMTYENCETTKSLGYDYDASSGCEYIIVYFTIENVSNETMNFSMLFTDFYVDGVKTPQTIYGMTMNGGYQLTATQVAPGKSAKGYLLVEANSDWKVFEVIYNEDFMKDKATELAFEITRG